MDGTESVLNSPACEREELGSSKMVDAALSYSSSRCVLTLGRKPSG